MSCCNTPLPPFGLYPFQPTVPKFYYDVDSQEGVLFALCCKIQNLIDYSEQQTTNINDLSGEIDELKKLFEQFQESGFNDYYLDQIKAWVNANLPLIYEYTIKQIYFGLTLEGYFVAYIPQSWDDITFDTGINIDDDDFGRLILSYHTNSNSTVIQPYL